ncbi:hypothetical protein F0562_027038 [Nyssa sinensis]|uniref:HMA domain-containing protein n=1 Tax=Nyssa sinensis TaxID=561372 RepID=A0A5J5B1V8_9ASTE|nr:hypothetical protein F0562_027038 [Nyssa sinensis]
MGEEKKEEEKKSEEGGKEEKKEEEKKEEPEEIVFKVDMHCEACARKVARTLRGFQGVEDVRADYKASKVVVKGKTADPIKVWERIQKKSKRGRKVELISPLSKPTAEDKPKQEKKDEGLSTWLCGLATCDCCFSADMKVTEQANGNQGGATFYEER